MLEHARPHVDRRLPYLSPWLRAALVIRQIRSATWDLATWPTMKQALKAALLTRSYSDVGPFRFRADQYRHALAARLR